MLLILTTTIYGIPYLIRYALYMFAVPAMLTECGKWLTEQVTRSLHLEVNLEKIYLRQKGV